MNKEGTLSDQRSALSAALYQQPARRKSTQLWLVRRPIANIYTQDLDTLRLSISNKNRLPFTGNAIDGLMEVMDKYGNLVPSLVLKTGLFQG